MNTSPLSDKPQPTLPAELALAIDDNTAILFWLLITQILVPHRACPALAEWIDAGFSVIMIGCMIIAFLPGGVPGQCWLPRPGFSHPILSIY